MTPLSLFADGAALRGRLVFNLAVAAAWAIARTGRTVVQLELTDDECEQEGVPYGSTEPAVFAHPVRRMSWWHLDAWVDRHASEHCWRLDALGWHAEVYYLKRRVSGTTTDSTSVA